MKNFVLILVCLAVSLFSVSQVLADANTAKQIMNQVDVGAQSAQIGKAVDFRTQVETVIKIVLETIGAVFIVLIIYGGFIFVTAEGEEEKIKKGLNILKASIVGLLIILMAYSITIYVGSRFSQIVVEGGTVAK